MRSRTYICKNCGGVRRVYDHSRNQIPGFLERHPKARCSGCGDPLLAMSHEQGAAATKITPQERLAWLDSGGFVLRGHGKPRWRPATSPQEISDAKEQEKSYLEARRKLGSRDNRLINEREDRLADITVDMIRLAISRIEPTRLQCIIAEREHSENRAYDVLLDIVNEDAAALEVVLGTLMSLWRRGYRTIAATIAYHTFLMIPGEEFCVDSQLIRPDLYPNNFSELSPIPAGCISTLQSALGARPNQFLMFNDLVQIQQFGQTGTYQLRNSLQ